MKISHNKMIKEIKQGQHQAGFKQLKKWVMIKMPLKESILQIKNYKSIMFMATEVTIQDPILNTTSTVKLFTTMQVVESSSINSKIHKKSILNTMMMSPVLISIQKKISLLQVKWGKNLPL